MQKFTTGQAHEVDR